MYSSIALAAPLLLFASAARAALPCKLKGEDYAALAHAVTAPLNREAVDTLEGKDAQNLCKARAFVKKVRRLAPKGAKKLTNAQGDAIVDRFKIEEIATGANRFVDEEERTLTAPVISGILAAAFSGKLAASDKPLPPVPDCPLSALTDEDYAALPRLTPPLTRESAAALNPKDQQSLCLGRRLLRLARSGGAGLDALTLSDVPSRLPRWVTKEEYGVVSPVVSRILASDATAGGR